MGRLSEHQIRMGFEKQPMYGWVESLNVSVAAAIVRDEYVRPHGQ